MTAAIIDGKAFAAGLRARIATEVAALAEYNRQLSALALAEGGMLERHGVEFAVP